MLTVSVALWGPVCAAIYALLGVWSGSLFSMVGTATMVLCLLGLRWTGSPHVANASLCLNLCAVTSGLAWISGGFSTPPILWSLLIPLIASMVSGPRGALLGAGLALTQLGAFYSLHLLPVPQPALLPPAQLNLLGIPGTAGLFLAVTQLSLISTTLQRSHHASLTAAEHDLEAARLQALEDREAIRDTEHIWAVGRISAGLAHEVNSPNSWVVTNLETLQRHLTGKQTLDEEEVQSLMSDALIGARRVAQVTNDLRAMARPASRRVAIPSDVRPVIDIAVRMARTTASGRIQIYSDTDHLPPLYATGTALSQAVLNLLINALDALTEANTPSPTVQLRGFTEGDEGCIEIADNGPGIPPALLDKVFQPHFTTKHDATVVGGNGLGLSLSRRAVRQMGGRLEVFSKPGEGCRFRIWLKLASRVDPVSRTPNTPPLASWQVLAIDDEPLLLKGLHRMLRHQEFTLTTTTSTDEAVGWVRDGQRYDLILCDLRMPGADPASLHHALRDVDPTQAKRIVVMTGGTPEEARSSLPFPVDVLSKPFTAKQVRDLLRSR